MKEQNSQNGAKIASSANDAGTTSHQHTKNNHHHLDTDFTLFPEVNLNLGSSMGHRQTDIITDSMDMSLSKLQETVKDREARRAADHGIMDSRTQLSNWTTTTWVIDPNVNCKAIKFLEDNTGESLDDFRYYDNFSNSTPRNYPWKKE